MITLVAWDHWRSFYQAQRRRVARQRLPRALKRLTPAQMEQDRREELEGLTWDTITRNLLSK